MESDTRHWAARDLTWMVTTALDRGRYLFTVGETALLRRMLTLPNDTLETYARLTSRRHVFQRAEDLDPHAAVLIGEGWVSDTAPPRIVIQHSTIAELRDAIRAAGLRPPSRIRRTGLVQFALEHLGALAPHLRAWVRVRHHALLRRVARFAFLRAWPDRSSLVVERLGHRTPFDHPVTGGQPLFANRAALRSWEQLADGAHSPSTLANALRYGTGVAPGRLNLVRRLARQLFDHARQLESDADVALPLYRVLCDHAPRHRNRALLRRARTLELAKRPLDAWTLLRDARSTVDGPDLANLNRTGRRLAKAVRRGWAPERPGSPLVERTLTLRGAEPDGGRPRFRDDQTVEPAVQSLLATHDRRAIHAEGRLWRHLFVLLFLTDCVFAPIPGQLPVRAMSGPLDLWTPGFAARRPALGAALASLDTTARDRIQHAYDTGFGRVISGVDWSRGLDADLQLVAALPADLLRSVFEVLLAHGGRALRGLPDLVVLPGQSVRIPNAHPSRLTADLFLAELKTASDRLSAPQRWWLARLAPYVRAEVWNIRRR